VGSVEIDRCFLQTTSAGAFALVWFQLRLLQ
jgi:hypothetical protein